MFSLVARLVRLYCHSLCLVSGSSSSLVPCLWHKFLITSCANPCSWFARRVTHFLVVVYFARRLLVILGGSGCERLLVVPGCGRLLVVPGCERLLVVLAVNVSWWCFACDAWLTLSRLRWSGSSDFRRSFPVCVNN